jgi:NAD(P)-dependent dehydrogenase (short-subunit alcohol dehydrogenase family)
MTAGFIKAHETTGWPADFIPEKRTGNAEDMAGLVLFLVSRAGAYINGNVMVTDGGRLGTTPATY